MNTNIYSAAIIGVEAHKIEIEIDNISGRGSFNILGFQPYEIRESRERILKAIGNCIELPSMQLTINLFPNYKTKSTSMYDLPIAIGILISNDTIQPSSKFIKETLFVGELSLEGKIRPIKGILPIAYAAKKLKIKRLIIPKENINEAACIDNLEILGIETLEQLIQYFKKEIDIEPAKFVPLHTNEKQYSIDYSEVKGHLQAKRAFQIAAAGMHNIILVGSPGSGKTMLSKRLRTIMPTMSNSEIIETTKIYSVSNKLNNHELITERPFREPHHTASQIGIIGGGQYVDPGEISLAHNGILFMDEFAEFRRNSLEALRQPLESGKITISRANTNVSYPASFLLVAALNPCPCGFAGDKSGKCSCNKFQIDSYFEKISGPLIDRIDLQLTLNSVDYDVINSNTPSICSKELKAKVDKAVKIQMLRNDGIYNGRMNITQIDKFCVLKDETKDFLKIAFEKLKMSSRSYHKIVKLSRTIADLEESKDIELKHVKEALMYRSLEKKFKEI